MVRYNNRRRGYKSKRPSQRTIRGGKVILAASTQEIGYIYEAIDPQTATRFKLDIGSDDNISDPIVYALVYIPEGYDATDITYPAVTDDLYNPTKNVLISGICVTAFQEDHKFCRYSRKMAPGDRIGLVLLNTATSAQSISYQIEFTTLH